MKFDLVKLEALSGDGASIYTVVLGDDPNGISLFDHFVLENRPDYEEEVKDIFRRLRTIGFRTGASENFLKFEEKPGDVPGIRALYDDEDKKLRLYCFRYSNLILILGGGGPKSKDIRSFQEDPKLTQEQDLVNTVAKEIMRLWDEDIIELSEDGYDLLIDETQLDDYEEEA